MAATYVLTTNVGKIRSLIPDKDITDAAFQDEELEYYLTLEGDIRTAAALALEIAAIDDVMTFKVMKAGSDSVDATKGAAILLGRAAKLRAQLPETAGTIGIVELSNGRFGARQVYRNVVRRAL